MFGISHLQNSQSQLTTTSDKREIQFRIPHLDFELIWTSKKLLVSSCGQTWRLPDQENRNFRDLWWAMASSDTEDQEREPFETHCVIELSTKCHEDVIHWMVHRITSPKASGGAELLVRTVRDVDTNQVRNAVSVRKKMLIWIICAQFVVSLPAHFRSFLSSCWNRRMVRDGQARFYGQPCFKGIHH